MTPPTARPRYYAFDALRASMMLLGLVLHVATSYTVTIPRTVWPFKDLNTSRWADVLVFGIHTFRMPVFFVMAGFFSALLREKYGIRRMLENRAIRILVPLVISWIVIIPLLYAGEAFAIGQSAGRHGWELVQRFFSTGPIWPPYLRHFWFLYLLLWFYLIAALLAPLTAILPAGLRKFGSTTFRRLMERPGSLLILALPTAALLFLQAGIIPQINFVPRPLPVLTHLIFFTFGWALYIHRDLLTGLKRAAWPYVSLAFLLYLFSISVAGRAAAGSRGALLVESILNAIVAWLCIFGLSGLSLRYLDRPIPVVRYLTDAAYWCYLVHLPLALWLSGLFAPYDLPAAIKIVLVLLMLIPLVLLTYHLLVRPTALGVLLGGKRRGAALDSPVVEGAQ